MPRIVIVAAAICVAVLPGVASAQSPTDPDRGSPSGTVYELPLDSAREYAAPRRKRPSGGERRSARSEGRGGSGRSGVRGTRGSGGRGERSPIRSENNFGSSSRVPGVDTPSAGASGDGAARSGGSSDRGQAGGSGGAQAAPEGGGERTASFVPTAGSAPDDGPSWLWVGLLVALLVLVGVTGGALAGRARRG